MYIRHTIGQKGEDIAVKYLLKKGYTIIERNFSCRQGELDIIAKDKNEIVFIEVKTRTNKAYGEPIDAITYYKKKHLLRSVQYYLYLKNLENSYVRIDVIQIYKKSDKLYLSHIKGVI